MDDVDAFVSKRYRVIKGKCSVCGKGVYKILTNKSKGSKH